MQSQRAKIILLSTLAAIAYGIVHDQVTARLCIEYFTIAHPPLFHTTSPTMLGLCWGFASTVWLGAVLGIFLALVSQSQGLPPVPIPILSRSIATLLAVMAVSASLGGILGFELSRRGILSLPPSFAEIIPITHFHRFMAVWFAHGASYLFGLAGSMLLIGRIWLRGRPRVLTIFPRTRLAILRALVLAAIGYLILWFRFGKL